MGQFVKLRQKHTHNVHATNVSVIAPDVSGGGMTRVYLISQVLQQLNYNVEIVGCAFGQSIYPPPPDGLTVSFVPGKKMPGMLSSLNQLLKKIQGDFIYAIKPRPTSFGIALLKKLYTHRPVLLDIDDWELSWFGGDAYHYRPSLKQLIRDLLKPEGALREIEHPAYLNRMEQLIPYADAITVNTDFLNQRFGGTYLPNGKDTDIFDPAKYDPTTSRRKYGLSDYRILMFPGTARPHKGLEDLLMALDQLNQPDLRLVVVGGRKPDGYEDDLLQRWPQWIIKLPQFPLTQMAEVVAAAHIVVVPQRNTATANAQFPIKLTDGMSMAKPILATRVGDIPKILADTGFLVDPGSPEQLAERLQWLFDHSDAAQASGQRARERCIKYYSTEAMGRRLAPIIANLFD
jgi:glycosyltransferase involved in cell wall biosynthesis